VAWGEKRPARRALTKANGSLTTLAHERRFFSYYSAIAIDGPDIVLDLPVPSNILIDT
jgi:hypothetical protein